MEPNRFEAIRNKTTEVLAKAQLLYGVDLKPLVSFNLRGLLRRAGPAAGIARDSASTPCASIAS